MAGSVPASARDLIRGRSHAELADDLFTLASDDATLDAAEDLVCALLAVGDLEKLKIQLDAREEPPLLVRILLTDAATRTASCSPEQVQELFAEVSRGSRSTWRLWISAVSADFSLWRGDLNGVIVAQAALIGVDEHDRGALHNIARGRLRRLLGLAALLSGPGMRAMADELVEQALADFELAGCGEEHAITRGLFATVLLLLEGDPDDQLIPQIRGCVDDLLALGSDRVILGWVALGWTSAVNFDFATVRDCLAELAAAPPGAVWPILRHFVTVMQAVLQLHADGPTPEVVSKVLAEFRELHNSLVAGPTAALYVAGVLLDAGAVDAAEDVMTIAGPPDPSISRATSLFRREIDCRIELLRAAGAAEVAAVEAIAAEQERGGDGRLAGEYLLRCAWDCVRVGLTDDAARLRATGEALVPPSQRGSSRPVDLRIPSDPADRALLRDRGAT